MDGILAPDVYVNASLAPGTPPEKVANRVFAGKGPRTKTTPWILDRVRAMLRSVPEFREDAIEPHLETIGEFVEIVSPGENFPPDAWREALVAAARAAGTTLVVTDHPDLTGKEVDGVYFTSTEGWLIERSIPPPPPTG